MAFPDEGAHAVSPPPAAGTAPALTVWSMGRVRLPSQQPVHPNICRIPPCKYLGKGRPEHFWRAAKCKAGWFASTQRRCWALCVCVQGVICCWDPLRRLMFTPKYFKNVLRKPPHILLLRNTGLWTCKAPLHPRRLWDRTPTLAAPERQAPRDPGLCRELGPRHERASTVFLPCVIQAQYQLKTALFKNANDP